MTYTHEQLTEAIRLAHERGRQEVTGVINRFAGLNGHGPAVLKELTNYNDGSLDSAARTDPPAPPAPKMTDGQPAVVASPEPPPPYYSDAMRAEEDAATEYLHHCQRWLDDHPASESAKAAVAWANSRLSLVSGHRAKASPPDTITA